MAKRNKWRRLVSNITSIRKSTVYILSLGFILLSLLIHNTSSSIALSEPETSYVPPVPEEFKQQAGDYQRAREAMEIALNKWLKTYFQENAAVLGEVYIEGQWAYSSLNWKLESGEENIPVYILAHFDITGNWQITFPNSDDTYQQFLENIPSSLISIAAKSKIQTYAFRIRKLESFTEEVNTVKNVPDIQIEDPLIVGQKNLPPDEIYDNVPLSILQPQAPVALPELRLPWSYTRNGEVSWSSGPHAYGNLNLSSTFLLGVGSGLDFSSNGDPFEVLAMAAGTVISVQTTGTFGRQIAIRHDVGGSVMIYGHLAETYVSPNQHVDRGTPIGLEGNTVCSTCAPQPVHLHIEFRQGNDNCSYNCLPGNLGGDPLGWDMQDLVDGYRISYFLTADNTAAYNYDGSAIRGNDIHYIQDFPFTDYDGTRKLARVRTTTSFVCDISSSTCEDNSQENVQFAGGGEFFQPNYSNLNTISSNEITSVGGHLLSSNAPTNSINDTIPPSAANFTASVSGGTVNLTTTSVQDNSNGSGVREVRFSAKWNNEWHGIGVDVTDPYSLTWDMCASGVPNGDVELGMEIWDNADNHWVWSEHFQNPHINKSYNCPTGQVYFYRDANYQGELLYSLSIGLHNDPNPPIKSMDMPSGWSVITYDQDDGNGGSRCWWEDQPNFEDHEDWSNRIRSVQIYSYYVCPPRANFDAWPNSISPGEAPLTVSFHNTSQGEFTNCEWDYGDGTIGYACSDYHDHIYNTAGVYTVKLTVFNAYGSDSKTLQDYITVTGPPSIPTNLQITNSTISSLSFSWQDTSNNETGFNIYRWGYDGASWSFIYLNSVGANVTSFTDINLNCQTKYFYTVSAYNGYGNSNQTPFVEGTTTECPCAVPGNVTLASPLNYSSTNDNTPTFQWMAAVDADQYQIEIAADPNFTNLVYQIHTSSGTQFTPPSTPLDENNYYWRVKGENTVNGCDLDGPWSPTWYVTVDLTSPLITWTAPVSETEAYSVGDQIVQLEANAVDNVAVERTFFNRWDAVNEQWVDIGNDFTFPYQYNFDTVQLNTGWNQINVRAYDTSGNISTSPYIWLYKYDCNDGNEPNNSVEEATSISFDQTQSGTICVAGDEDYFQFSASTGDNVVIDIDARPLDSLLDSYIYLIDSDGTTILAYNDDADGLLDSKLGYSITHDGTYYIKVREYSHPTEGSPEYFYNIHLSIDNSLPSGEIITPYSGAWLNPNNELITVTATDSGSGINRVEFLWHDGDWVNSDWIWLGADQYGADGWSYYFDTSAIAEQTGGALYIWAFDYVGNWIGDGVYSLGIDRTIPTSYVEPLDSIQSSDSFLINWSGSDNLSGISANGYDIQYKDGIDGIWTDWLIDSSLTSATFTGIDGHTYYFRSRSQDNAGNQEPYPLDNGDTVTTIDVTSSCKTLTINSVPIGGGSISVDPLPNCDNGTRYTLGTIVELTAINNANYTFTEWGDDAAGSNNIVSITMDDHKSVTANFTPLCYSLSLGIIPLEGGDVTTIPAPNCNNGTQYISGTDVQLIAVSNPGYTFNNWSGDISNSASEVSINIDENKSVTANFSEDTVCFSLSTSIFPFSGGNINISPEANCNNGTQYTSGTVIQLTASSNTGYSFDNWTGDISSSVNPISIVMNNDKTVNANFVEVVGPSISIPNSLVAYSGASVSVPVNFTANDFSVVSTIFKIDYDQSCLSFDPLDSNSDGIPDAITFNVSSNFATSATYNENDSNGELEFFIADITPPLAELSDGLLVNIEFTVVCQTPSGTGNITPINFSNNPSPSFGDNEGKSIPGSWEDGSIEILANSQGDCNGDNQTDAGDISALVLEIFDGDGNNAGETSGGTFPGNASCDANEDTKVDAGDISCTVLLIFEGPGACSSYRLTNASNLSPQIEPSSVVAEPFLMLSEKEHAPSGGSVTIPIEFAGSGNEISSLIFSIDYDQSWLTFDPADNDSDGIPDAISFNLPGTFSGSVTLDVNDADGELDFFIADLTPPLTALPDGVIAYLTLGIGNPSITTQASVKFSQDPMASFGNTSGQSIVGTTVDGSVYILANAVYLPTILNNP